MNTRSPIRPSVVVHEAAEQLMTSFHICESLLVELEFGELTGNMRMRILSSLVSWSGEGIAGLAGAGTLQTS